MPWRSSGWCFRCSSTSYSSRATSCRPSTPLSSPSGAPSRRRCPDYAPLAGKLVHLADTGDVAIRCSASDDGVRFVVAESEADVRRLAGDEEHDVQTFERLVPELDMTELPAPLLAVQATRLGGGGVALGVTVHHAVADGRSLWKFVEAWAAACRGGHTARAASVLRSLACQAARRRGAGPYGPERFRAEPARGTFVGAVLRI